ncbi:alpha-(1,3)-fucosyltransferase 7-like [Clupea harengus]|uniref:Fucosyltransferase n=1 Tax=Clupea harengus TaxID=7950 RepID=A0A6P8EYW1_CLUHA|nr:alpha-(1,3)-fucosyltransferase 7-like [Clupea harengus]
MDSSPRQDNCEKANRSKRRCRWILGILVLFCFIFAGHYFQWSAFRHSALLSFNFQRQEPKGITGATTLKPTSITSTLNPPSNTTTPHPPSNTTTPHPPSNTTTLNPPSNTIVLLWYWPFEESSSLDDNFCIDHYGIPNCVLVTDHSWFPKADLIVFHNRELVNGQRRLPLDLPRPEKQRWIWLSLESPPYNGNMRPLAGRFNYTMSYRRDSDIYTPYGHLVPSQAPNGTTVDDFIPKGKTSLACWIVSNYNGGHERTAVYNRLKNIIPVDVYGGAVNKRLSSENLIPTVSRYYFYLSFENSIFRDYITEKVWRNAFAGGAVPVVLGPPREQYEAVMPKDSFIHVNDFSSVEELGHFLKTLAEDKERYATYFNWRLNSTFSFFTDWREELCKICPQVRSLQRQKVYDDLHGWDWQ